MVSGVGMHMTHHTYAVYSGTPGELSLPDEAAAQKEVAEAPVRAIRATATGRARIAAYSVVHDREGPSFGEAVCDLPGGDRCYARTESTDRMREMEEHEWVGRDVTLEPGSNGVNMIAD